MEKKKLEFGSLESWIKDFLVLPQCIPSGVYRNINAAYKLLLPRKGSNYSLYKSEHASVGVGVCMFVFCAL